MEQLNKPTLPQLQQGELLHHDGTKAPVLVCRQADRSSHHEPRGCSTAMCTARSCQHLPEPPHFSQLPVVHSLPERLEHQGRQPTTCGAQQDRRHKTTFNKVRMNTCSWCYQSCLLALDKCILPMQEVRTQFCSLVTSA